MLREEHQRAHAAGVNPLLPKPVEFEQLVAVLARWIGPAVAYPSAGLGGDASLAQDARRPFAQLAASLTNLYGADAVQTMTAALDQLFKPINDTWGHAVGETATTTTTTTMPT